MNPTLEELLDGWYVDEAFCHMDVPNNPCYARLRRHTDDPFVTEQISGWGDTFYDAVKDASGKEPMKVRFETMFKD